MFFLLFKRTDNGVFDDFPKISDHFPKISEDFPKLSLRPDERSRTFFENFRRLSRKTRRCFDQAVFRWYTNEFKYNLRDKPDVTEIIDIFTCEDIISSHVRISYRFYQSVSTRYTTDFDIIKSWLWYNKICFVHCLFIWLRYIVVICLNALFVLYHFELHVPK